MTALTVIEQQAMAAAAPREVLNCRLGGEEYGIDILAVQEIRRFEPATRIANAAAHLLGVTNLRGVIVPIIDLRHRMGLPAVIGPETVIIIVVVAGRTVGLTVDSVADVVALKREQIQPRPGLGNQVDADYIVGLATLNAGNGQRMLILIDLEALLRDL